MFQKLLNRNNLGNDVVVRLGNILLAATVNGEAGVVDWVHRAYDGACVLGHLRERDVATLIRLEDTFNGQFYTQSITRGNRQPIFA